MPAKFSCSTCHCDSTCAHVLSGLLCEIHEARLRCEKQLMVWSGGTPRGASLYVDVLADACVRLLNGSYDGPLTNIGTDTDVTIRELPETWMRVVGLEGKFVLDASEPDGMQRKPSTLSRPAGLRFARHGTDEIRHSAGLRACGLM